MPKLADQLLGAHIEAGCTATLKAQLALKPVACEQSHGARLQVTEDDATDAPWQKYATIDSPRCAHRAPGEGFWQKIGTGITPGGPIERWGAAAALRKSPPPHSSPSTPSMRRWA